MRGLLIPAATVVALALAGPATAQETPSSTMKSFGLTGEWAKECAKPASDANPRTIFTPQPDGAVKLTYSFGATGQINYTITKAVVLSSKLIVLSETNDAGQPADVTVTVDGKRTRVLASYDPSIKKAFIGGGKLLNTGKDTSWDSKCK